MGNVNSTVDAIQYEEVAFNSQEDYEQDTGSYSTFYYIESEQLLASITNYNGTWNGSTSFILTVIPSCSLSQN